MNRDRAIEILNPSQSVLTALNEDGVSIALIEEAEKELSARWECEWGNRAERLAIFILYEELKQKRKGE